MQNPLQFTGPWQKGFKFQALYLMLHLTLRVKVMRIMHLHFTNTFGSFSLFCLLLVGCASRPSKFKNSSNSVETSAAADDAAGRKLSLPARDVERLSRGNSIRLKSLDDKKLNGQFRIAFDGSLVLPYEVALQNVDKMTLNELSTAIREKYRPFFTGAVQIGIEVSDRRVWLDIRGLVVKPGKQLVNYDAGLDEVLALGGGLQAESQAEEVYITRADGKAQSYGLANVFEVVSEFGGWQGGETIFFRPGEGRSQYRDASREARSIQILGEVRKPGLVLHKAGADFLYYFTRAEGPTAAADLEKIEVIRGGIPNSEAIQVKWSKTNSMPVLQAGDIVVVRAKEPSVYERALPFITTMTSVLGTVLLFIVVL